jgi:Bacillus haemolytic enterotoxin (HBL)
MSIPVITTPDLHTADIDTARSAATSVTNYAQATITAVPRLTDMPDWFAPVQAAIDQTQAHSQNWITAICPAISTGLLQSIVDFSSRFSDSSNSLLAVLDSIESGPGIPTASQKQEVSAMLASLISTISDQQKKAAAVLQQVAGYATTANQDQLSLAAGLNTVVNNLTNGQSSVSQLSTVIGNDFLDSNLLGPCSVIVTVNFDISVKVGALNLNPAIISTVYAKAILENILGNVQSAQKAVQTIVDAWSILQQKYSTVSQLLQDAAGDDYTNDFKQLDFETAQEQWQQLAAYAAGLLPS